MDDPGGGIVKRTVFQFDFDLSTANKSNEQLVEMQKRLRSEVEKTEKEIQTLINNMSKMKMSGELSGSSREGFLNLGAEVKRLQDFSRTAIRVIDEIDIQFKESSKQADLFSNEAKKGLGLVKAEAKSTQTEIAKIGKEFERGTAEAKSFALSVAKSKDQAAADLATLLGTYTFGSITPTKMARGKPAESQAFQSELFNFGTGVQMGGGASRLPTYSEELEQFEKFISAVTKAEPILVNETQTIREYAVQMDNLSTATVRVRKNIDEFGNIKSIGLDKQVLPELNEFNAKAMKLQQDGYKFFATIEDGSNVTKLFAKVIDGTVSGVARLSGELDVVTGDLKRVSGGVLDSKNDFQKLFEMLTIAGSSGTITSFLPEEKLQKMMLFLGEYTSKIGVLTRKQERDFREASNAFEQSNMRMLQSAEKSESQIASSINRTTSTIEAQIIADEGIIDVTPVMVESVNRQAAAQEKLQGALNQTQAELQQTQNEMRETAATGAMIPPSGGRMTAFGVVPPTGGGGGGGGGSEFGGRSNPAIEFRNQIAMAMEELQRITNVRDFPGLTALQKEIDVLRQQLIRLADDSRMGLVSIESAGQQAEEYVMSAREFTGLWGAINKVALELERADKSYRSFGEMKPGTEAQVFFNELDRSLKNMDGQFKRGEISATDYYRRLQLIGDAIGTTGKRADIYTAALSRAFKAMQTEKAAEFRKVLSQINIELMKGGSAKQAISRLESLKKEYSENAQAVERLERTIKRLDKMSGDNLLRNFNAALQENRLEIKEGTVSLEQYLGELERTLAEWQKATGSLPEFGPRLRKEIAAVKSEIQTNKWKEFTLELTRIQQEFREAPGAVEPFIQRLRALKAEWAGSEQAGIKIDRLINQLQESFARSNFGAFREQLAGIKAQFQTGEISAREWLAQLQALLSVVGTSGPAFNELARGIQAAQGAANAAAMREYKGAVQELTAQAAAGAITQGQLVNRLEALRPQVEGNAAAMQHLELSIAKARRGAGDMGVVINNLGKILKTAQHHAMWMLSGALIMPLYNLPFALVNTVKELDSSFTKLKTVLMLDPDTGNNLGKINKEFSNLQEAAFKFAQHYGEEVPKVNEVMFQVAQKYKKSADIIVVSNQVMRLSLLDFNDNAEETATALLSLIAQFNLAPKDLDTFINKVILAGNAVRASAGEIMEGLTRSASMFKSIGADADTAIVLIAASLEKTGRTAEVVGTSWRNLAGRMSAIEKVGETLKKFGVEVYNEMQTAEDFSKTMETMKEKYLTMSDEMKASFVATVAGQRQLQTLIPILEDTDKTVERLSKTIGISKEEMEKLVSASILEQTMTIDRRIKSVGAAFQYFWWSIAGNPKIKTAFISFMFKVMGALQWIQEHFSTIKTWIGLIASYVAVQKLATLWTGKFGTAAAVAGQEVVILQSGIVTTTRSLTPLGLGLVKIGATLKAVGAQIMAVSQRMLALYAAGQIIATLSARFASDEEKENRKYALADRAIQHLETYSRLKENRSKSPGEMLDFFGSAGAVGIDYMRTTGISGKEMKATSDYMLELGKKYNIDAKLKPSEYFKQLKEASSQELAAKQAEQMKKEMEKWEKASGSTFKDWEKQYEDKASDAEQAWNQAGASLMKTDDETKMAGKSIDTYSSSVTRLKKDIDLTSKSLERYNKYLENQDKLLHNLIDLAPYQIYSSSTMNQISSGFDDMFGSIDLGFQKNITSAQVLYGKLTDITSLREQIIKQNAIAIQQSKTETTSKYSGDLSSLNAWGADAKARASSGYGPRKAPVSGASKMHRAYDTAMPVGTPLHAVSPGTVTYSGKMGGYGNTVKYELSKGLEIRLSHLDKTLVNVGDKISAGQIIAKSGNTGISSGAHLDTGFYVDNKPVKKEVFQKEMDKRMGSNPMFKLLKTTKEIYNSQSKAAESGVLDVSDKAEKAADKMQTNLQELDGMQVDLMAKVTDLYSQSGDAFTRYVALLGDYDKAMKGTYDNLTQYQTEYNDWLLSSGQITLDDWYKKTTEINGKAAQDIGKQFAIDINEVSASFEKDPMKFREQIGKTIDYDLQRLREFRTLLQSGAISNEEYNKSFEFINNELISLINRSNYATQYYEQMKKNREIEQKLIDQSLQLNTETSKEMQAQYDNQVLLGNAYGDIDLVLNALVSKNEELLKYDNERIDILEKQLLKENDVVKRKQIQNEITGIENSKYERRLQLAKDRIDYLDKEYEKSILLRDVYYEYLRAGATSEEETLINRSEVEAKLADAYTRLNDAKKILGESGIITEQGLLNNENIQSIIKDIASLNLELYKLNPAFEAINKISREAADNMVNSMKESIKAFVKGEQSFAQMLKGMVKAQGDAVQETIASSFAEAIAIKMTGETGAFEKRMQDLSGAIFSLFGLTAPDKRPVLDKIYDDSAKAIRVILAGDNEGGLGGFGGLEKVFGRKTGGTGGAGSTGNPIIDAIMGKGKMTTTASSFGKINFSPQQRQGLYIGLAQYMGQGLAQSAAGPSAGNETTSMATNLGATLGWGAGTATGGFFGSLGLSKLGAAAGPVGAVLGMVLGGVASNAFGVGRGEQRRQAIADQQANRQAEIDSIKDRLGALGFDEDYINQMASSVPNFVEMSKRSKFGLSGTSRWLEGVEAVYAEIGRQKAMLDAMEKTVDGYNDAVKESNHQLAMGVGRFDVFGNELNAWGVDMEGGRVAVRVAGQNFEDYYSNLTELSGAGAGVLSPFINMNGEFNTLTDRIEMMTYWLNQMDSVGLGATDTFQQLQEQLYELQQKKYWADIFQPLKEGEWLQGFGIKTDQDMLAYYQQAVKEAFGYQGDLTENAIKDLAQMISPEVGLLQTGQIEGFQAQDTQNRADLLQALWDLTNKINDQNLAQAAVGSRSVGEAISGTAQVVQNYNTFEVSAENFFSTKTEMLNIAREFATMIKQQGWIDTAVFNI